MVERALADFAAREQPDMQELTSVLLSRSDDAFLQWLVDRSAPDTMTHRLLSAMTGGRRRFYKRLLALNRVFDDLRHHNAYERIYHLDRNELAQLRAEIAEALARLCDTPVSMDDVIIDTPPRDKDRIETVQVVHDEGGRRTQMPLELVSKVVQGIATDFVKVVKKIRIFVAPEVRDVIEAKGLRDDAVAELFRTILAFRPDPDAQQVLL